jgi:hypothetical protein
MLARLGTGYSKTESFSVSRFESFVRISFFSSLVVHVDGVRPCLWTAATNGPIVHPPDNMSMKSHGGMILTEENRRNSGKTCLNATVSIIPTWTDPGANPRLRGERPATNRLSHGTNILFLLIMLICVPEHHPVSSRWRLAASSTSPVCHISYASLESWTQVNATKYVYNTGV